MTCVTAAATYVVCLSVCLLHSCSLPKLLAGNEMPFSKNTHTPPSNMDPRQNEGEIAFPTFDISIFTKIFASKV